MTEERLVLAELLEKAGEGDFLRAVAEAVLQLLMETDVEGLIGAGRYERSGERTTWRNGHRDRTLDTRLGTLQLRIPKLRQGSYFPPFPEARKSSEKALIARYPGDVISTVLLLDPRRDAGSMMLHAGWRVKDQAYGASFGGYLPFPVALLRAVAYDPGVAYSLCRPVGAPRPVH